MMPFRRARLLLVLLPLVGLAACSSSATHSPTKSPSAAAANTIVIKGFAYSMPVSVHPGAKITVRNQDSVAHTVTAKSGHSFDVKVAASSTTTMTAPAKAGSYALTCTYHPYMHATLVVK